MSENNEMEKVNETVQPEAEAEVVQSTEVKEEVTAQKPESEKAPVDAAPEEEKPAEKEETVSEEVEAAEEYVDKLEEQSLNELQVLREKDNAQNQQIVEEAEKKIKEIYEDLRTWLKANTTPDKIKENLETARKQTVNILNTTRDRVLEIADSDDFKKAVGGMKDFLSGTGSLIAEGFNYGKEQLSKNPAIKDFFDNVDAGLEKIRENEALHTTVEKAQEVTNSLTNSLFSGLKSFFEGSKSAPAPEKKAEEAKPEEKPEEAAPAEDKGE